MYSRTASFVGRLKRTLPAAISRRLITSGLFFALTREGLPFINERARAAARTTRAKRFSSFSKQSSTVTRAIDSPDETKGSGKLVATDRTRNLAQKPTKLLENFRWAG